MKPCILIVGSDAALIARVESMLRETCMCTVVESVDAAAGALRSERLDAVVFAVSGDDETAIEGVTAIKSEKTHLSIVIATAAPGKALAGMLRRGAYDYVTMPCDPLRILHTIQRAMEFDALCDANRRLKNRMMSERATHDLVGNSLVMEHLREKIGMLGRTMSPVLITGEPGTGKRTVARCIHEASSRSTSPLEVINCGTIASLAGGDELFGVLDHGGGIRDGMRGGTLVFDEIGELSAEFQARLYDALSGQIGGESVRVIATSSVDLKAAVRSGRFREDLYYRVNMVSLDLPPLRERREDIPCLIGHFVDSFARTHNRPPVRLTDCAAEKLLRAHWRGNVRELQNVIEQATVLNGGQTLKADYFRFEKERDERLSRVEDAFRFGSIREMERLMILNRLTESEENRTRSAKTLDISVRTLRNKLHEYNVPSLRRRRIPSGEPAETHELAPVGS